tara:strand:+ start:1029 stop:1265 length:237 start_codon:yes stop_codon:yes gene_type:complete
MAYQFIATTKEWRDKVNGNSYFSSVVEDLEGNVVLKLPFQYGYGSQSEYEIEKSLSGKIKFIKIDGCKKKEVKLHGGN